MFSFNHLIVKTSVIKTGPVIDSVRVLGQWVNGRTIESLVEPVDSDIYVYKYINNLNKLSHVI